MLQDIALGIVLTVRKRVSLRSAATDYFLEAGHYLRCGVVRHKEAACNSLTCSMHSIRTACMYIGPKQCPCAHHQSLQRLWPHRQSCDLQPALATTWEACPDSRQLSLQDTCGKKSPRWKAGSGPQKPWKQDRPSLVHSIPESVVDWLPPHVIHCSLVEHTWAVAFLLLGGRRLLWK